MDAQDPFAIPPTPLPGNRLQLQRLREKLEKWLDKREDDRLKLKKSLRVFLAQANGAIEEIKAGRLPEMPPVPAFMDTCKLSELQVEWRVPGWAIRYLSDDEKKEGETLGRAIGLLLEELVALLKGTAPRAGKAVQAVELLHDIANLERAQTVAPMEALYDRVLARLAELEGYAARVAPADDSQGADAQLPQYGGDPGKCRNPRNDGLSQPAVPLTSEGTDKEDSVCSQGDKCSPNLPRWDRNARTLYLGGVPIREFNREASNQFAILDGFQTAGWPQEIKKPLAIGPEQMKSAIGQLNSNIDGIVFAKSGGSRNPSITWRAT